MEEDWDLHAVVRGCAAATSTIANATSTSSAAATATTTPAAIKSEFRNDSNFCFSPFGRDQVGKFFSVQDQFGARNSSEELHELYKPFFAKPQLQTHPQTQPRPLSSLTSTTISPISSLSASQLQTHQKYPNQQPKQPHAGSITTPRSKRRKNQLKKVCQVPAESLSSDIWAWRKYGQKPIKGSPYPRGYYRCSSSKGCLARKQVERNRSDPGMFIVTYTAEHNHPAPTHRNSLAGSTRQKPYSASDSSKTESKQPACSSSPSVEDGVVPQGRTAESKEDLVEDEEEDDEFGLSDMVLDDDFFVGFEELDGPDAGECFSDNFPASFGLPWMVNNAAAAADSS